MDKLAHVLLLKKKQRGKIMADSRNDAQFLKEQEEKKRQEILDIATHMKNAMGYNSGSTMFDVKETPNGNALVIRGQFDPMKLPGDWKYESNYLLDSDYAKEGIYRMVDGKREFIPIVHERDKSEVTIYRSPEDVVNGILAENPHINKDQIYFDNHSGAIQLVGVVNNITMPAGLEMQDGFIVDINDYNKKYEVRKELANNISINDIQAGGREAQTYGVRENITRTAYQEEASASIFVDEDTAGSQFQDYGKTILDFAEMGRVYENYTKNARNEVVSREKDGSYKVLDNMREHDPLIEAKLEVAQVWVDAYTRASGSTNGALAFSGGVETEQNFNRMISIANSCQGKKVSELVEALFNNGMEAKIAVYFLTDPRTARMFNLELDLSPEMAVNQLENLKEERSQQIADDAMESVEEFVMEMKRPNNYN